MTAVDGGVVLLIALAVLTGTIVVLGGLGRIPMSMQPPTDPWWSGRAERRRARRGEQADGAPVEPRTDDV